MHSGRRMTTATADSQLAEMQRKLNASKQQVSRLEHELVLARAAAKEPTGKLRPTPPPTPPAAPPAPLPAAPSLAEKELAAAQSRITGLREELAAERQASSTLRSELAQSRAREEKLQAEVASAAKPSADAADQTRELQRELQRARAELASTTSRLEEERELRRHLQRRLENAARPPARPPPEVVKVPVMAQEPTDGAIVAKIAQLDGKLGKLERQKESVEDVLRGQVQTLQATVAQLKAQLPPSKRGGGCGASPRAQSLCEPTPPRDAGLENSGRLSGRLRRTAIDRGTSSPGGEPSARKEHLGAKEKRLEAARTRLLEIDPNAAAEMETRAETLNALRQRLQKAQAQSAVETMAASMGITARVHGFD